MGMRIAMVTANHGRDSVLDLYLSGIDRLREQTDIEILSVVVGSQSEAVSRHECLHIPFNNDWVTDRFNEGFRVARELSPTHVMINGSDNNFSVQLLNHMEKFPESNFIGVRDINFVALDSKYKGESIYILSSIIGCCRLFSASLLDKVYWKPFNKQASRGIDGIAYRHMQQHFINPYVFVAKEVGATVIDFKTSENINSFDKWASMARVDTNEVISFLSDKEKEILNRILK